MTQKEIEAIADAIWERIKKYQEELDEDFFGNLNSVVQQDMQGAYTWAVTEDQFAKEILDHLEKKLESYIESENYAAAVKIKKEIEDLKNKFPDI